jgi:hypothetical protein
VHKDAYDMGGDFVVDGGFVVFTYDVNTEFLAVRIRIDFLSGGKGLLLYHMSCSRILLGYNCVGMCRVQGCGGSAWTDRGRV